MPRFLPRASDTSLTTQINSSAKIQLRNIKLASMKQSIAAEQSRSRSWILAGGQSPVERTPYLLCASFLAFQKTGNMPEMHRIGSFSGRPAAKCTSGAALEFLLVPRRFCSPEADSCWQFCHQSTFVPPVSPVKTAYSSQQSW